MKRTLVLALALLLASATPVAANYQLRAHWHYVSSYIYANDSMGTWQVVEYYHIKMNGSSPFWIPSIQQTSPVECVPRYSFFSSVDMTSCTFGRYSYGQWQITARWKVCPFGINWFCASHGMLLRLRATGAITERSTW